MSDTKLDPGQDQRGKDLADQSTPKPLSRDEVPKPGEYDNSDTPPRGSVPAKSKIPTSYPPDKDTPRAREGVNKREAVRAFISGNPKRLRRALGGGIVGLVLAAVLMSMTPLLAEFKLSMILENLSKHGFRHLTHSYVERQRLAFKYFLKESLDPTFDPNGSIVNYDRSMWKNVYGKLRGDDKLAEALRKHGYRVETKTDPRYPGGRITTISHYIDGYDQALDYKDFDRTYNILFEGAQAAAHIEKIANEVYGTESKLKRIMSVRRLQIITGVKLHWLDPITAPFKELRYKVRNATITYILEHSPGSRRLAAQLISLITGQKIDTTTSSDIAEKTAAEITQKAAGTDVSNALIREVLTKTLTEGLTKVIGDLSNPVGWVLLGFVIDCALDELLTNGYEHWQHLVASKAELEYAISFIEASSALAQIHEGKTNGDMVGAFMEKTVDEKGRDATQNNNWERSTGKDVPYQHTDDCESGRELCDAQRPESMGDRNVIGRFLKQAGDFSDSIAYELIGTLFFSPGNTVTHTICSIIRPISNFINDVIFKIIMAIDYISTLPQVREKRDYLYAQGGKFVLDRILVPMLMNMLPPLAHGRGPAWTNGLAAGALASSSMVMRSYCGNLADDVEAAKECKLTGPDLLASEESINRDLAWDQQHASTWDRVASLSNPSSVLTQLIVSLPTTVGGATARLAALPQYLFAPRLAPVLMGAASQSVSPTAFAEGSPDEPTGVGIYGYTEDCLQNTALNDGSRAGCKGMDKLDDTIACSILLDYTKGKEPMPDECDPDKMMKR